MKQTVAAAKKPTMDLGLVAVLTAAAVIAGLWFLRAPAQSQPGQQQLNALAERQMEKPGQEAVREMDLAVKKVIRQHAKDIQKPWLAYLATKPARTEGTVTLSWLIEPDGKPRQVQVVRSDFEEATFNEGVRKLLAGVVFAPLPAGLPRTVTHKLVFKQEPTAQATPTPPTSNANPKAG